jgi:uncharacterized protein YgiM (DUF1202 family)
MRVVVTVVLLLFSTTVLVAEQATLMRSTELRAAPFRDAEVVQRLGANTNLQVVKRKGGWYQVKTQGKTGWVRMTTLMFSQPGGKPASGGGQGADDAVGGLLTGRSSYRGVTAATGIRGLDAVNIRNATPNAAAVAKMDKYAVSAKSARSYASSGGLKSKKVAYLTSGGSSYQGSSSVPGLPGQ